MQIALVGVNTVFRSEEPCGGVWWSVVECGGVCWSDEMKCDGWLHQPQKVTSTPKSHINPKKSKK